jgi:hypothetical protein
LKHRLVDVLPVGAAHRATIAVGDRGGAQEANRIMIRLD